MNWLLLIIVGGLLGWIASKIMHTDAQQGIILNIVVGIVGSILAGWLISPLLGVPPITSADWGITSILVSLVGAIILLAIVNLLTRKRVR